MVGPPLSPGDSYIGLRNTQDILLDVSIGP